MGTAPAAGLHACGKGWVLVDPASPAALAHDPKGPAHVLSQVRRARESLGLPWSTANLLALRRGPYVVAGGMAESLSAEKTVLPGSWVSLFDDRLSVHIDPEIQPDTRWLLYDLARCPDQPWVIAAAGLVQDEKVVGNSLSCRVSGMANTACSLRARVPDQPVEVTVGDEPATSEWDPGSRTVLVRFPNQPRGAAVEIRW
jgi:hypothetical protein